MTHQAVLISIAVARKQESHCSNSREGDLADVVALALFQVHQEAVKGAVLLVDPMVLNASPPEVPQLAQGIPLLRHVERQVRP